MKKRYSLLLAAAALLSLTTAPAHASIVPGVSFSTTPNLTKQIGTYGYTFGVGAPLTLAGLSFYDAGGDGLSYSHAVGLWTNGGALLASLTIDSGVTDLLDAGGFRYKLLAAPLTLAKGTYRVAGFNSYAGQDSQVTTSSKPDLLAPGIIYRGFAISGNPVSMAFPSVTDTVNGGMMGGSIEVVPAAAVPEPSTYALFSLGLGGLAFLRRRGRS